MIVVNKPEDYEIHQDDVESFHKAVANDSAAEEPLISFEIDVVENQNPIDSDFDDLDNFLFG